MTKVAELIPRHSLLFYADSSESVRDVARQMAELNIGAVAVLKEGQLAGVFSERDLMTRIVAAGLSPDDTPVAAVMTREVIVGHPDDDLDTVLKKLAGVGARHLPIVDKGKVVAMLSLRDLMNGKG